MYLEHFRLCEYPFSITPNTHFYCNLPGHQAALNVLSISIRSGEGFIKIVGEVGTGKTLLCRLLLNRLGKNFVTAYIPNPDLSPNSLRKALAQELEIPFSRNIDQQSLLDLIYKKLLLLHQQGKSIVLLVDEAQALPADSLEALRLLTNLETETKKLLQVVLFGQPELDQRLKQFNLRQVKQRISFSYRLPPMKINEMDAYVYHRLAIAGYTYGSLFTASAKRLLFKKSGGLPRVVNLLCHKALMIAYGRGDRQVSRRAVQQALLETEEIKIPNKFRWLLFLGIGVLMIVSLELLKISGWLL